MSVNFQHTHLLEFEQIKLHSSQLLEEYLAHAGNQAADIHVDLGKLVKYMQQSLVSGNRRGFWFTYLGFVGAGGTNLAEMNDFALAIELYNAALLLHDDVIDGDFERNGVLNVAGAYQQQLSARVGVSYATKLAKDLGIVGGDVFFGLAYEKILLSPLPIAQREKGLQYLLQANRKLNAGQQLDILGSGRSLAAVNEAELLELNALKNHWNIALPLVMGAYCAGASDTEVWQLEQFAYTLGGAVQIANDVDLVYNVAYNSKTLGDLRERKKTLWLWYGWSAATPTEKEYIVSLLGRTDLTMQDVAALKDIFATYDVQAQATQKGLQLIEEAVMALREANWLTTHATEQLQEYVAQVAARLRR